MNIETQHWIFFNLFIVAMLVLDLFVFHRKTHVVKIRESLLFTAGWILLALIFCGVIYYYAGKDFALEFLAAYLIEKSLSFDNIFVFILIFSYFNVPPAYQHKVLFWGVAGALIMRIVFIFAGIAMIAKFHWIIYVFSGLLIITAIKLLVQPEKEIEPDKNWVVRLFKRYVPVLPEFRGTNFFVREGNRIMATPLVIVLLMIELSDIIFAVDSIPAILAISNDLFIVYSSNVFAIMGLRSLFFAVSGLYKHFRFLKYALSLILLFVGAKLALSDFYKIPTFIALLVIAGILLIAVVFSLLNPRKDQVEERKPDF
jgi:tellurite resistance protein TerC